MGCRQQEAGRGGRGGPYRGKGFFLPNFRVTCRSGFLPSEVAAAVMRLPCRRLFSALPLM